jgi:hypothetical protein
VGLNKRVYSLKNVLRKWLFKYVDANIPGDLILWLTTVIHHLVFILNVPTVDTMNDGLAHRSWRMGIAGC